MSSRNSRQPSRQQLWAETEALRARLAEAEDTLRAIHEGEVDAIIVSGSRGERVFSLTGSEYIYRQIVETMKEAALTVSLEGRILFCNDQFRKLIKESPARIVGRPLTDFVTPDQKDAATAVLRKSRRRPVKQRLVFQDTGGVPVPAHISSHVLNQPDGPSICIVATDVTEIEAFTEMLRALQRHEEALQEAHAQLQTQDEELRAANEELQSQQEELHSQAEELREAEQATRRLNEQLEQRVAARTAALSQANEALRQAERAVRTERQRFNGVLETLPAYLVLLTRDHHVSFANRFFRERFGESHGRRCFEYLFHRTEPCEVCETYKVLETMTSLEWEWTGPDGRNYYIYDFPFTDTDGSTLIMEVGLDITERKCAERALQEANEKLEQRVVERTEALRDANERLQAQAEELQSINEELNAQAEELSAQAAELQAANEALRTGEEKLAYLASFPERNPNPVLEVDLNGRIRYLNPAAERLFPDLREQGTAHPWLADWTATVRPFKKGQTDTAIRDLTVEKRTYQQALHYFARDRFVRIYAFDITERKQAEQKLAQENDEMALANRILQVFVEETGDDLFEKALQIVLKGTASRHGVFGYVEENGDLVCPSMSKLLDECEVAHKCIRYPQGKWKGLWSRALREKRTLYTNEPPGVPPGHVPICNNLAAPILFQGRAIGLLNLANKEDGYAAADCERIEGVARRVAPILYAWVQKRLRENERTQAEQALAESEQRLRLALEAGGMGHWEWDLQKDSPSWCERSRELLDLSPAAPATAERFLRCVHPDDREAMRELTARTLLEPTDFQVDFRVLHNWQDARGEIVWLTSRGRVVRDEQGRGVRLIGVLYDVTQRKQMEEQLRRLNERLEEEVEAQTEELRHTIDRLQDEVVRRVLAEGKLRRRSQMLEGFFQHTIGPLAFLDRQFSFVRVNEAYARAEGKDAQSLVGQSYFALHPDPADEKVFRQVVRSKEPYRAYARPFHYAVDPRAATYWDWQLTPLLDERGQVQFLVFNLEDVTARQKAFQELEQRARQLQKLTLELAQAEDRERRRLAEILHDDLQQQLAAAKFHLGILSGRVRDDATVQELAGQVNHLLKEAIAKSRSLSHELSPAVLYQSDLGETFEWLARQMEAKHGLTVHVEVRGPVGSQADALKAFLYRSAQELLFNVIKHARVKEARLRLQRARGRLWLTVSDQGPGFELPTLGRTSGFGLLGIRERVELLGGRMKIRSVKGRGSTFLITVPEVTAPAGAGVPGVLPDAQTATGRTKPSVETPPAQRLHVLLVDDHEVMREGLAALLAEQADIEVVGQAGNGREAVDLAYQLRPEVVIMDVAMPVMAGDEATRQIKLHLPGIRVIALSMFDEPEMAERMRQAGAAAYLLKTGPSEDLLAAIRDRPRQ